MSEYVCRLPFHGSTGEPGRTHVRDIEVTIMERVTRCAECDCYEFGYGEMPSWCLLLDYPTGDTGFCSYGRPREETTDE